MQKTSDIKFLLNHEIDKQKWDECINKAYNSRVYGLSVYLDEMCSNWSALILSDYNAVMPLTWRKKFGIHYLYQPAFCQQLGVFSKIGLSEKLVALFLSSVPEKFKYWEIALNSCNSVTSYNTRAGKNYLLSLNAPYENLYKNYNRNAKRNIKKAIESGINICENVNLDTVISLHRTRFEDKVGANNKDYEHFLSLLDKLSAQGKLYCAGVKDKNDTLIASSIYLLHNDRIIFIINGNLPSALANGSTYLLKDFVVKKFCGKQLVMDFEGSDNEHFSRFYQQFGAEEIEYYPFVVNNKLPWPLKYLKRSAPFLQ